MTFCNQLFYAKKTLLIPYIGTFNCHLEHHVSQGFLQCENQSKLAMQEKKKECSNESCDLISSLSVNCYSLPMSGQMTIYKAITGLINCHYCLWLSVQLPKCLCALLPWSSLFN